MKSLAELTHEVEALSTENATLKAQLKAIENPDDTQEVGAWEGPISQGTQKQQLEETNAKLEAAKVEISRLKAKAADDADTFRKRVKAAACQEAIELCARVGVRPGKKLVSQANSEGRDEPGDSNLTGLQKAIAAHKAKGAR